MTRPRSDRTEDPTAPAATFRPYDDRALTLGEGPLWHPERGQLFWFDIMRKRLLTRTAEGPAAWTFETHVSAAGWVDRDRLLVASATDLRLFDLATGTSTPLCPLEADNPATRSNDGRADPWGGFWIGTMGLDAQPGAGAIWRWWRGELRRLFAPVTISNAIAFPPGGGFATFADTAARTVWRVALDPETGWPAAGPEVFLDLSAEGLNPDGAVFDAAGRLWLAEWGAARVSAYDEAGRRVARVTAPTAHVSCPAFGGPGLGTLFATTATQGLSAAERAAQPQAGMTFSATGPGIGPGLAEHRVILP